MHKLWGGFLVVFTLALGGFALVSMQKTAEDNKITQRIAGVQVGCDEDTLEERVKCRIENEDNPDVLIMPEECRPFTSGEQERCVDRYKNLDKCWNQPLGSKRSLCAMEVLGIKKSVKISWQECAKTSDVTLQTICKKMVRQAALNLAKFRMDDLSERVIDQVQNKKLTIDKAVGFIVTVEKNKVKLQNAKNYTDQKKALDSTRTAWRNLVNKNKLKNMSNDYLQQSYADLAAVK
ncbi:MAG TPA: hypothetical protein VJA27_00590 [Patescibacteria group bacterium]|nr:hypothetical protein [Patescibacteria group bacterium]